MKKTLKMRQFLNETNKTTKRFSIALFISILLFLATCFTGVFPTAYAYMVPAMAHKDFNGSFYSLKPSRYSSPKEGSSNKYYYTLVDEGTSDPSLQYFIERDNEVYLFEYYAYLNEQITTNPNTKVAVYSKSQLEFDPKVNMYKEKGANNQLYYKNVTDYLFFGIKKFNPNWELQSTPLYSSTQGVSNRDSSYDDYYAYEYYDGDKADYQRFDDIDVSTQYKFNIDDLGIKYDATYTDQGNFQIGDGSNEEVQYISPENDNGLGVFVLNRIGNSYVTVDINGNKIGNSKGQSYYKGGQFYIYNNDIKGNNNESVNGFEVYSLVNAESTTYETIKPGASFKPLDAGKKYSIFVFENGTTNPLIEAVRYYDQYKIDYEIIDVPTTTDIKNVVEDDLISKSPNIEFVNQELSKFHFGYEYYYKYNTNKLFKVHYQEKELRYFREDINKSDEIIYELKLDKSNVTSLPAGTKDISSFVTDAQKATSNNYETVVITDLKTYSELVSQKELFLFSFDGGYRKNSDYAVANQNYYDYEFGSGSYIDRDNDSSYPDNFLTSISYLGAGDGLNLARKTVDAFYINGKYYANATQNTIPDKEMVGYDYYKYQVSFEPNQKVDPSTSKGSGKTETVSDMIKKEYSYQIIDPDAKSYTEYHNSCFYKVKIAKTSDNPGDTYTSWDTRGETHLYDSSIKKKLTSQVNTMISSGSSSSTFNFKVGHSFYAWDKWTGYTISFERIWSTDGWNGKYLYDAYDHSVTDEYWGGIKDKANFTGSFISVLRFGETREMYNNYNHYLNIKSVIKVNETAVPYSEIPTEARHTKEECVKGLSSYKDGSISIPSRNDLGTITTKTKEDLYGFYCVPNGKVYIPPAERYEFEFNDEIKFVLKSRNVELPSVSRTLGKYNSQNSYEMDEFKNIAISNISGQIASGTTLSQPAGLAGLTTLPINEALKKVQDAYRQNISRVNTIRFKVPNVTVENFYSYETVTGVNTSAPKTTNLVISDNGDYDISTSVTASRPYYNLYYILRTGDAKWDTVNRNVVPCEGTTIPGDRNNVQPIVSSDNRRVTIKHSYYHSQRARVDLVDKNVPVIIKTSNDKFLPEYRDPRIQDKWYNKSYPQYELVKVENNTVTEENFSFIVEAKDYPVGSYKTLLEAWNGNKPSESQVRELVKKDLISRGHEFFDEKFTPDSTPDKIAADHNNKANVGVKMHKGVALYNAKKIEHKFSQVEGVQTKALASDLLSPNRTHTYVKYRIKNSAFLDTNMTFNDFVLVNEDKNKGFTNSTANIFNEADFFKRYADSGKYLRIEGDANNKVYTVKEPITINNLPSNAYASYYLDGQLKNAGHVGNSFTINAGKISKIMITKDNTTDPGRYMTYSRFVSLSLARGSDGDNNYFEHKLKINRSRLSETTQTYIHTDIKINTYLKENKDNLSKILGSAVYVKNPETGVWNINFPNIDWTSAGIEQYIDLSKHINGQSIMDYRAGIKNYGSKDAPFTINAELAKKLQVPADSKVFFTKLDGERRNVFFKFNVTTAISSRTTSNDFINVNKSLVTNVPSAYDKTNYEYAGTAINFFNSMIPSNHSTTYQGPDSVMVDLNANYKGVYVTRGANNVQDVLARIQQVKNVEGSITKDYFVINNNGVYKLIKIKGEKHSKYRVYRDLHKTKHPNGEVTYNDEGFNAPITDLATITDFNELNRVTVNVAGGKYTPPTISSNNIFDNINVNEALININPTTIGRHPIANDKYNEVDPNKYNLYEKNNNATKITLNEIKNLLFLSKDSIRADVNNDYVTPDKQARYRIVFDDETFVNGATIAGLINNKLNIDDYRKLTNSLVDTFELTGQWQKYEVLDEYINAHPELFKKYTLPQGYNVPYFIDPSSIYQFSGTSTITESSMFIYRIKLKADGITIPSNLAGKWVVENPRISGTTYDQGGTINPKSFNEDFVNAVTENKLFKGMNNYLLLKDKVDLYRLKTKREYKTVMNAATGKSVLNKAYDLRSQLGTKYFNSINDTEDKIVFFYGDDLLMKDGTTYKGINVNFHTPDYENLSKEIKRGTFKFGSMTDKAYVNSVLYGSNSNDVLRTYNGYLTDDPKLGGLRAGYYHNTIEKLYYEGKVYHLGSIVDDNKTQAYVDALRSSSIYEEALVPTGLAILKQIRALLEKNSDKTLSYTLINDMYTDGSWGITQEQAIIIKDLINSDAFSVELNLNNSITKYDVEKLINVWASCQNKLKGPSGAELSSLPESVKNLLTIKLDERVTSDGRGTDYIIYNNKIYYEYCDAKNYTSGVGVAIDDYVGPDGSPVSKIPYITRPDGYNDNIRITDENASRKMNRFVYIHDFSEINPRFESNDLSDPFINWIFENEEYNAELRRQNSKKVVLNRGDYKIVYDPTRYIPIDKTLNGVAYYDYRNVAGLFLSVGKLQNSYNANAPLVKASAVLTETGSEESPYCTMNLYDSLSGNTNGYILSEVNNDNFEHLKEFAHNIRHKDSSAEFGSAPQAVFEYSGYASHGLVNEPLLSNEPFIFHLNNPENKAYAYPQILVNSGVLHNKLNTIYSLEKNQLLDFNNNVTQKNVDKNNANNRLGSFLHGKDSDGLGTLQNMLDIQFYNLTDDLANYPYFGGGYNLHFDNFPYNKTNGYLDEIALDSVSDGSGNHLASRRNEKNVTLLESTIYNISNITASRLSFEFKTNATRTSARSASFIITREKDDITATNFTPKFSANEFGNYGYTADANSFILHASSSGRIVNNVENGVTISSHKVQKSNPHTKVVSTKNYTASRNGESVIYEVIEYTNEIFYSNYYSYYDHYSNRVANSDRNSYNDGRMDYEYKSAKQLTKAFYWHSDYNSNTYVPYSIYDPQGNVKSCKMNSIVQERNFEETTNYKSIRLGVTPENTLNSEKIDVSYSFVNKWNENRLSPDHEIDLEIGMSADNKNSTIKLAPPVESGYDLYKYTFDFTANQRSSVLSSQPNSGFAQEATMTTGTYRYQNGHYEENKTGTALFFNFSCFRRVRITVTSDKPGSNYVDWDTSGATHLNDRDIKKKLTEQINLMISSHELTFNFKVNHTPFAWGKWTGYTIQLIYAYDDFEWKSEEHYNQFDHEIKSDFYWDGIKDKTTFEGGIISTENLGRSEIRDVFSYRHQDHYLSINSIEKVSSCVSLNEIPENKKNAFEDALNGLKRYKTGSVYNPYTNRIYEGAARNIEGYYYVKSNKNIIKDGVETVNFGYSLSYPERVGDTIYPKLPNYHLRDGRYYYEDPDATFHEGSKNFIIMMLNDASSDAFYNVKLEGSMPYRLEIESYTNGSLLKPRSQVIKIDLSKPENKYFANYDNDMKQYLLSDKLRVSSDDIFSTMADSRGIIKGKTIDFISPVTYEKNPYNLGDGKQEIHTFDLENEFELYTLTATYGAEWFRNGEFDIASQKHIVTDIREGVYYSDKSANIEYDSRKDYDPKKLATKLSVTRGNSSSEDESPKYGKKSKEFFLIDTSGETSLLTVYTSGAYKIMRELNDFYISNSNKELRKVEGMSNAKNKEAYFYSNEKPLGQGREVWTYFACGAYGTSSNYSRYKITITESSQANGNFFGNGKYMSATAGRDGYWEIETKTADKVETKTTGFAGINYANCSDYVLNNLKFPDHNKDNDGWVDAYNESVEYVQSTKDGVLQTADGNYTANSFKTVNFTGYKALRISNIKFVKKITKDEIFAPGQEKMYSESQLISHLNDFAESIEGPSKYIDIYDNNETITQKGITSNSVTYRFYKYTGPKDTEMPKTSLLGDKIINQYNYLDKNIVNFLFGKTAQDHPIKNAAQKDTYTYVRPGASFIDARSNALAVIDAKGNVQTSSSLLTEVRKTNLINANSYEFSRRYLMQRYTPDDNVTGITFRIVRADTNEPVIQSGVVAQIYSKVNGTKENVTFDAQTGIFTYKFSPQDLREYNKMGPNGRIYTPESFVKDYLLNNNLEFGFKNLFSQNDTNIDFNIQYDSFFERKNFYFDYNQNGKYDGNVKLDKPYYDINGKKVVNEEQNFFTVSQLNDAYGLINGKKPAMFDNPLGLWKTATFSVKGKTGTALRTTPIVGGNFVYLRLYDSGESHIVE